jgi:hypothetical protein
VFLLIKIIWGINSEQYKKSYNKYILKTMKASAILSLIFSPIVILGVLYGFFDSISQLFTYLNGNF